MCVADFDEAVIYCRDLKVTYIYFFFSANTHVKGVKTTFKVYPQIPFFPDISVSTYHILLSPTAKYLLLNSNSIRRTKVHGGCIPYFL